MNDKRQKIKTNNMNKIEYKAELLLQMYKELSHKYEILLHENYVKKNPKRVLENVTNNLKVIEGSTIDTTIESCSVDIFSENPKLEC